MYRLSRLGEVSCPALIAPSARRCLKSESTNCSIISPVEFIWPLISLCHIFYFQKSLEECQTEAEEVRSCFIRRQEQLEKTKDSRSYRAPKEDSAGGRRRYHVRRDQIERLLSLCFTHTRIAELLGISRMTLWRRMRELDVEATYDGISDDELDKLVEEYRKVHPFTGERELLGHIRSRELHIQRYRVRDSIHRVDPINTALRWHDKLQRKPYSVPRPNSLWHIDANLKLVRWGFVIQASMDGYSRVVVYRCQMFPQQQS